MGINDINIRKLILKYINQLLNINNNIESPQILNENNNLNGNICCICVQKEVNTATISCGHAVYCNDCSKQRMKHNYVDSIMHIFKSGFDSLEI